MVRIRESEDTGKKNFHIKHNTNSKGNKRTVSTVVTGKLLRNTKCKRVAAYEQNKSY
jgi:hypothetical protein